jgi:hypothetical protein
MFRSTLSRAVVMLAIAAAPLLPGIGPWENVVQARGQSATVTKDEPCNVIPPISPVGILETFDSQKVLTPGGNAKMTCTFHGPSAEKTVVVEDFLCLTDLGLTTQARFVYTRSGRGTLTCQVKANS